MQVYVHTHKHINTHSQICTHVYVHVCIFLFTVWVCFPCSFLLIYFCTCGLLKEVTPFFMILTYTGNRFHCVLGYPSCVSFCNHKQIFVYFKNFSSLLTQMQITIYMLFTPQLFHLLTSPQSYSISAHRDLLYYLLQLHSSMYVYFILFSWYPI